MSGMYGEQGNKLAADAKRIASLAHLPPYATTTVRTVLKEVKDLDRETSRLLDRDTQGSDGTQIKSSFDPAEDPGRACALLVSHLSIRRNKRNLLAYHRMRTGKLEEMCWNGVDISELQNSAVSTASAGGSRHSTTASSLSAEEEQYAHQYSELLAALKGQWTDIDLTGSLEPPKDIFIDVRVLKDAGEIQTEYGSITLTKNSQFYVRQGDVERLIQQGYLQRLS
jgi:GINS complex subunit 1